MNHRHCGSRHGINKPYGKLPAVQILFLILTLAASSGETAMSYNAKAGSLADADAAKDLLREASPFDSTPKLSAGRESYILSFAGDCVIGSDYAAYAGGSFEDVVGDNYGYPFENAREYFSNDDFTLVNLECVLTDYNVPAEKQYRFRGPPEYAKILSFGSVECVSLANNHSLDFGIAGYSDTKSALESERVAYVENRGKCLFETENGLVIGVYAASFSSGSNMKSAIQSLHNGGAQIVIASFHWGTEGSYRHNRTQEYWAHLAIDSGADLVVGHHPHVLQEIERYGDGIIFYSLGNLAFGGNRNPADKDTAIVQQEVTVGPDGTASLGKTAAIPFCLSEKTTTNTYKPTPYEEESAGYDRVLAKLYGTFAGPDLIRPFS